MKRLSAILVALAIMISAAVAYAAAENNDPAVYARSVTVRSGDTVSVPILVRNNPGIMGFAILINYDPAIVQPTKVEKGGLGTGLFDDSLGTGNDGSLKVLFTGSDNFTADGTLFTVTFQVLALPENGYEAALSYSQADTFNASWQDVVLTCEPIVFADADATTESTTEPAGPTDPSTPGEETTAPATVEDSTTAPQPEPPTQEKLSVRIRNWAAGLPKPFNVFMKLLTAPIVWIVSLFE